MSYLGLLLRDIVYMADAQADYIDKSRRLVNFAKIRSLYQHIEAEHTQKVQIRGLLFHIFAILNHLYCISLIFGLHFFSLLVCIQVLAPAFHS